MKHILLITTGGTIASLPTDTGLSPKINAEELLREVPEIRTLCEVSAVALYRLDSTNMRPENWLRVARFIRENYDAYDGFVITHGTDTMAYASAMLFYLIQNSPKPIVMTGSQISISERDTDARDNLLQAFRYVVEPEACGVHIVFDGKVIAGTRARKNKTKSFDAFSSVDYPEVAVIRGDRVRHFIKPPYHGPVIFYDDLDPSVMVVKLIPGMSADIFDFVASHCHAVIIESFGVGGLPYYDSNEFADKIEMLIARGVRIVITTQVPHEGSDMSVYRVGLKIKQKYELPEAYDMTTEAVVAKVMWALPLTRTAAQFRKLFRTPIGSDIL
ncbi:MAG: asparaginase [Clostridia bacterium]|nr:asparaginase [Clostridia bacterium]